MRVADGVRGVQDGDDEEPQHEQQHRHHGADPYQRGQAAVGVGHVGVLVGDVAVRVVPDVLEGVPCRRESAGQDRAAE